MMTNKGKIMWNGGSYEKTLDFTLQEVETREAGDTTPTLVETRINSVQKIAVLRANRLGDFIFALPALQALREAYPQAEIVLLGREWHAEFLRGRRSPVDRVVVVPAIHGIYSAVEQEADPHEVDHFFGAMAEERFDLAIQVHGDGRYSNPFVQRLGARLTAGTRNPDASPLDLWVPYSITQSEFLRNLEVVSLVGARTVQIEPRIEVLPRDLELIDEVLPKTDQPVAALYPGSSDPHLRWSLDKFAAVGDSLSMLGVKIAVIGNEDDRELGDELIDAMSTGAINLCGRLTLNAMVGFLARCALLIGNNSEIFRLAWAVNTPTVGIFWFGHLLSTGPLSRRKHRPAISWRANCPVCGIDFNRDRCEHISLYDDVTTVEVLASALELISHSNDYRYNQQKNDRRIR